MLPRAQFFAGNRAQQFIMSHNLRNQLVIGAEN